jgi:AhpD family alkylhydroperoxidase
MNTPRIDINKHLNSPLLRAMFHLSNASTEGIDKRLFTLVKIRASQINHCAYCIDMHTKEARAAGETEQRIYALSAWRETPFFSERERAALDWAETVTLVADTHVPDDAFARASEQFTEDELIALTFAVIVINSWNRLSVAFRPVVGSYQPKSEAVSV